MMTLLKFLHAQGIGSRKQCQALIRQGRVTVNGQPCDHEQHMLDPATVTQLGIDDAELAVIPLPHYCLLLHKPAGYETSHKPRDYPSVFSLLPDHLRATAPQAVGRLDADTSGVLLITNDGPLNHRLTSPKYHVSKLYRAQLKHAATDQLCRQLCDGVLLHDEQQTVRAASAELADAHTLLLTLCEGKYHQVKRMVAAAGNRVEQLHRLQFGPWRCDDLPPGGWRFIDANSHS